MSDAGSPAGIRLGAPVTFWAPASRICPRTGDMGAPSDSRVGQRYPLVAAEGITEIGSRLALVSLRHGAHIAWPDTRNARATYASGQDIFSAEVSLPQSAIPRRLLGWVAAIGLTGVTAVAVLGRRPPR